jgi:type II secretory pathway pseudopilin PulG
MKRRRGFSLLELLGVLFGLAVLLALFATVFWGLYRVGESSERSATRVRQQALLIDQFRGDISECREAAGLGGDYESSPMCLVERVQGETLIYKWHDGVLERAVLRDERRETQVLAVGADDATVSFGRKGKLVTMTIASPRRSPLVIAASLGGDLP